MRSPLASQASMPGEPRPACLLAWSSCVRLLPGQRLIPQLDLSLGDAILRNYHKSLIQGIFKMICRRPKHLNRPLRERWPS
jgi:hypothetical protein